MPLYNPALPGMYCAGASGDEGVVSVDRQVVLGPSAGADKGAQWLNSREVCAQFYTPTRAPQFVAVLFTGGTPRVLVDEGVVESCAGGGRFGVLTKSGRVLLGTDHDTPLEDWSGRIVPMAFSPDGALAYRRWHRDGLLVTLPGAAPDLDNDVQLVPDHVRAEDVQGHEDGGWTWREGESVRAYGLRAWPRQVQTRAGGHGWQRVFRIGAEWWLAYLAYATNRVICHRAEDARTGYDLGPGPCYRLDAVHITGRIHAVYSSVDRDAPGDLVVPTPIPLSQPEITFHQPDPEPEDSIMEMPREIYDVFAAVAAKFQDLHKSANDDDRREATRRGIETIHARVPGSERWQHKRADGPPSKDTIAYVTGDLRDGARTSMFTFDMIDGNSRATNAFPIHGEAVTQTVVLVGAKDWLAGDQPGGGDLPAQTHRYIGGGNDTGTCDQCGQPKFAGVHEVPEGKVPHAPWLGEDGKGNCDLCFQPVDAAIHQPAPDPGGGDQPTDGEALARIERELAAIKGILTAHFR